MILSIHDRRDLQLAEAAQRHVCDHEYEDVRELVKPERRTVAEEKRTADSSKIPYAEFTYRVCTKCGGRRLIDYQVSKSPIGDTAP